MSFKFVWVFLAASLVACSGQSGDGSSDQASGALFHHDEDQPVTDNFAQVNPNLYRGARPELEPMRRLKNEYGIKTIVSLELADYVEATPGDVEQEEKDAAELGIKFVHEPMTSFDPALRQAFDERIDRIMATLRDPANQPAYVHCRHGRDRTGLAIGLERVIVEGWTPAAAHEEMIRLGFRKLFINLELYFEVKTGWEPPED